MGRGPQIPSMPDDDDLQDLLPPSVLEKAAKQLLVHTLDWSEEKRAEYFTRLRLKVPTLARYVDRELREQVSPAALMKKAQQMATMLLATPRPDMDPFLHSLHQEDPVLHALVCAALRKMAKGSTS